MSDHVISVTRNQTSAGLTISPEVYFQMESNPVGTFVDLEEEPMLQIETMVTMNGLKVLQFESIAIR